MNIILSLIGVGGILLARHIICNGSGMGINSHLIILSLKLFVSSIIIGSFLLFVEKYLWSMIILTGMVNLITFHFIEAFVTQKKLLHRKEVNV